jgi:hypothetical protein
MSRIVSNIPDLDALRVDLARRHRASPTAGLEIVDSDAVEKDWQRLQAQGCVVIERLLDDGQLAAVCAAAAEHLGPTGRNTFEGAQTQRAYGMLNRTRALDALAGHARVLALLDRVLLPNYLLSQVQLINVLPGEAPQLLHHDDAFYPVPRPRAALSVGTIWAVGDFTADNGATRIVPGSHRWDGTRQPLDVECTPCAMPAGSVVVFLGTLWHGAGGNRSTAPRLAATCQYCEPWLRTQVNYSLEMQPAVAGALDRNLQRMLGYSIHPPFLGMVDGMHPLRALECGAGSGPGGMQAATAPVP